MPRNNKKLKLRLSPEQQDKRKKKAQDRRRKKKILDGVTRDKWRKWS